MDAEGAHREHLTTVCAYVVTFDDGLRGRLLQSEPGTPFRIDGSCSPGMERLIQDHGLRYWVTVARKLGPATATVVYTVAEGEPACTMSHLERKGRTEGTLE